MARSRRDSVARPRRSLQLALLASLCVSACGFQVYQTRQSAAIGYPEPPNVILVNIGGDPSLGSTLEQRLGAARMRVVARASIARSELDANQICSAIARGETPPSAPELAGLPRDTARFVVVASADLTVEDHDECSNHDLVPGSGKFSWEKPHKEGPSWDILPSLQCVEYEYDSTVGAAFAWAEVLDLATCSVVYEKTIHTDEVIARSGDRAANRASAEQGARAAFAGASSSLGREFFPRGVEVTLPNPAPPNTALDVKLRGEDAGALATGARYRVFGERENARHDRVATLIVREATPDSATATVEPYTHSDDPTVPPDLAALRVGDSIRSISHPHDLYLLPLVSVERMQDGDSRTVVGGSLAVRWSYPRFWLYGEAIGTGALGRNTLFTNVGIGLGLRIPILSQLAPYGMASIAESHLRFTPEGGALVTETTPRPQLIGGVEVRIGKTVVLVDVRYAWTSNVAADRLSSQDTRSLTVMFGLAARSIPTD